MGITTCWRLRPHFHARRLGLSRGVIRALATCWAAFIFLRPATGASIIFYSPSVYNANTSSMDTALGITGAAIDDFEDSNIVSGFSITLVGDFGGYDQYPFNGPPYRHSAANQQWDGSYSALNLADTSPNYGYRSRTIFNLPAGTRTFGVGLSGVNEAQLVLVNGVTIQDPSQALPGWSTSIRNGYLKILTTEAGETLQTVELRQKVVRSFIEEIVFDHIAMSSAVLPEPSTAIILYGSFLLILLAHRRESACAARKRSLGIRADGF